MPYSTATEARASARDFLAESLPARWSHVSEVARRASIVSRAGDISEILEIAAWSHDIGYAPRLAVTGFHPLDGARYLRSLGAPDRVVGLVAFHSAAAVEAEEFGVADELAEFEDEQTLTRDLLWYLDMTTGPDGQCLSFDERMSEVRERYPADHYVIQALDLGMSERVAAVERATGWLSSVGLDHV